MRNGRRILIVGGGTAGWLTAAYLARHFELASGRHNLQITLLEAPEIGVIGVGEGAFPTIRKTMQFIGVDEAQFIRKASATFKQGIRFVNWTETPVGDAHSHYFHPFEAPFYSEDTNLVAHWLLQDEATRPAFAEALTIQSRVAEARRAPKRPHEDAFDGPLSYAYHFDALKLAEILAQQARSLGVVHRQSQVTDVALTADGAVDHVMTREGERIEADLYVDCSGFRAELIGSALKSPFRSVRDRLFTNRAIACKIPHDRPDQPLDSYTIATAHEAGWIWDIGLNGARGIGCVYSSDHIDDDRAETILRGYVGDGDGDVTTRRIPFEAGYREKQWIRNCVSVGLSAGFLEPLESTGLVLIEAAAAMIAELFPLNGPVDSSARRFNELMAARYENIINFLKLHYCLSKRAEGFWRDNTDPASIPERLKEMLEQWRYRPPARFDFILDLESFAFYNYQYILYGMGFRTDLSDARGDFNDVETADRLFARIRKFGERATQDLPTHRDLIEQINRAA